MLGLNPFSLLLARGLDSKSSQNVKIIEYFFQNLDKNGFKLYIRIQLRLSISTYDACEITVYFDVYFMIP